MKPPRDEALRAAKLSHVPGVTLAEARARFAVTRAELVRARKLPGTQPTLAELALAALTANGTRTSGAIDELAGVAGWIDHLNHDGCTVDDVRALLAPHVELTATTWRFPGRWP